MMKFRNAGYTTRLLSCLLVCGALTLTACSTMKAPVLDRVTKSGELRVGTTGNMPPLNAKTKGGQIIGLEADLARIIADAMGVNLELVTMPFAELLPALEKGDIDMILSGMTMTPKRNLKVAFVGPYFISGKALLTKSEGLAAAKEAKVLNSRNLTLAALQGSTSQVFVETGAPLAKLVTTSNYDEAVDMVIDGRVDAVVADFPIVVVAGLRHPDADLAAVVDPLTFEPLGVAVPAGDPLLVNWLENLMLTLEGTGVLTALRQQWLEDGTWLNLLK